MPVLAFLSFFLKHLLLAAATDSIPGWMPTSLVKCGHSYVLLSCSFLVLFTLLLLSLQLFPCWDDFFSFPLCSGPVLALNDLFQRSVLAWL